MSNEVNKISLKELDDITKMVNEIAKTENVEVKDIRYILNDKNKKEYLTVASNLSDKIILLCDFDGKNNVNMRITDTFNFVYDSYIFKELEKNNKEITYISPETHKEIHEEIENNIDKLKYKKGCEEYIDYFLKVATITKIKVKQIGIDPNNNPIYMDDNWNIYTDTQPLGENIFIKNIQTKIDKDKSSSKKNKDMER